MSSFTLPLRLLCFGLLATACAQRPQAVEFSKKIASREQDGKTKTPVSNSSTGSSQDQSRGPTNGKGNTQTPVDTTKPGDSTKPNDTTIPGDNTKPVDTSKPGDGTKPDDTTKPGDTTKPVDDKPVVSNLADCPTSAAINQLQKWWAAEGNMIPGPTTNIVQKEGGKSIAKVTFVGSDWHVVPVWLGNTYDFTTNLSKSKGLTLTYKAPGDFFIQLRPAAYWSGGAKHGAKFLASPDKFTTVTIPFDEQHWTQIPGLGAPPFSFATALADARGLVIVGKNPGEYVFTSMLVEGFTPPCR